MKTDSKHQIIEESQVIEISDNFIYNKKTHSFISELSEIRKCASRQVVLKNPKTGGEMLFNLDRTDTDKAGEDVYGWHYISDDGMIKLLLIND